MSIEIHKIELTNFKSYTEEVFSFDAGINCILGDNGKGKTNLLDAIFTLCMTKSAFSQDALLVHHQKDYFTLNAIFKQNEIQNSVWLAYQKGKNKVLKWNDQPIEKMSEHIGKLPCVLIKPDDIFLINEGSEERRKFFDGMICQSDSIYLHRLSRCNHFLKERNALLKKAAESKTLLDFDLLKVYDEQLMPLFAQIYESRQKMLELFIPFFEQYYAQLSGSKEKTSLIYKSQLENKNFAEDFEANIRKDMFLERTEMGVHKDDYVFKLNNFPIKKYGSQGQMKSFLLALKLAAYQLLAQKNQTLPILMLDDIFDKLDPKRLAELANIITQDNFGQVLLTDAHVERARAFFDFAKPKLILL
jgi:DNA replication and repair protein RecF